MLTRHDRRRGFTLIELMVTLAIVAIVLVLGLPGITQWMQNSQIRTAAESIQNGLQTAKAEAIRRNGLVEFSLDNLGATGGTGWTVRIPSTNEVIQSTPDAVGSKNVALTTDPADSFAVTFNGFGRPPTAPATTTNADGSAFMTQVDIDNATLAASDSRNLRVAIDAGGEIRMCDPSITDPLDPRRC